MTTAVFITHLLTFAFALWLGLYLMSRNWGNLQLRLAGLGLIAYAVGLSLGILAIYAPSLAWGKWLWGWERPFLTLPAFCWLLLLWQLWKDEIPWQERLKRHPRPTAVIVAATLFFALGMTAWLLPFNWLPRAWVVLGIGIDLVCLGLAIALLDAFDEGETLRPHFFRSLDYALFTALLFGGQVALVMVLSSGITFPMLCLLLTTITAAIFIQTFADPFQTWLDRIAFFNFPQIRQTRSEMREIATAVTRFNPETDLAALNETELTQLTRRALSHMGNLPKLSTNPLTQLPVVIARLSPEQTSTLERAAMLKKVLTESIERLKPPHKGEFGTTDEWRHYNAVYFPYVLGLKPYSRREVNGEVMDSAVSQALEWFRTQVPERTLHNWQNAAARLVAQDLREQSWH